jgi:hypothetical protein
MSPAPSTPEEPLDESAEYGRRPVGWRGAVVGGWPKPGRGEPPSRLCPGRAGQVGRPGKPSSDGRSGSAPRIVVHVEDEPRERAAEVAALSRRRSKLARGAWSWVHAHLLLGGSGVGPWDYHFVEDDYRRLARRPHEDGVFRQR